MSAAEQRIWKGTCMSDDYREAIRHLPRTTLAQAERFALHVSRAHSWYKHLPIRPKVPFVFYLDPGAGMNLVQTRTGETALVEITDEKSRFHYTWQTTVNYRRRFGHWNYQSNHAPTLMFQEAGGVVNTAGKGLTILTESGDWVFVPPDLVEAGMALVNAFVHPSPNLRIWADRLERFGLSWPTTSFSTRQDQLELLSTVIQHELAGRVSLARLVESVSEDMLELVKRSCAKESDVASQWGINTWDWPDDQLLNQLQSGGLNERLVSAVIKYTVVFKYLSPLEEKKNDAMSRLSVALAEERGRQLMAMTDAMSRFQEASASGSG